MIEQANEFECEREQIEEWMRRRPNERKWETVNNNVSFHIAKTSNEWLESHPKIIISMQDVVYKLMQTE